MNFKGKIAILLAEYLIGALKSHLRIMHLYCSLRSSFWYSIGDCAEAQKASREIVGFKMIAHENHLKWIKLIDFLIYVSILEAKNMKYKHFAYKGYKGKAELDKDLGIFVGRVLDIPDVVTFQGETIAKTEEAFKDSVDDYLGFLES
jgi:predicted RNase H-like HicB family nuclease